MIAGETVEIFTDWGIHNVMLSIAPPPENR
jgi:hypothetical protein